MLNMAKLVLIQFQGRHGSMLNTSKFIIDLFKICSQINAPYPRNNFNFFITDK